MSHLLGLVKMPGDVALSEWIFENLFLSWAKPVDASLAFAVSYVLLWLFLIWLLYRKRMYIKV